jgi:hypothetical protein
MMRFRLSSIAYVFALLAASMAVFGAWGIAAAMAVLLFWAAVFNYPPITWLEWVVVAGVICVLIALLLPVVDDARPRVRTACQNNTKQILLALSNYEAVHETYPPA